MTEAAARGVPAAPEVRRAVLALVADGVRLRFAVDAERFADRVVAQAAAAGAPAAEYAGRLDLDDLYLATACAAGDERAWDECAARHFGFIRDFARRFLAEPASSDVADEVIADLWKRARIARYEGRSTLRTWLGALVAHAALNARKRGRHVVPIQASALDDSGPSDGAGAAVPADAERESRALLGDLAAEAMAAAPADVRLLLLMHYEQGLTLHEMGLALRTSKATLSRRLKRARADLYAALQSLSRRRAGASIEALRAGIDLGRLEFDLSAVLSGDDLKKAPGALVRKEIEVPLSNSRGAGRDRA